MKCLLREDLENLVKGDARVDTTPDSNCVTQYYFCCIGEKTTRIQRSPYALVEAISPHYAITVLHDLFPDKPRIDGNGYYIDYITVNKEFAKYAIKALDLPTNVRLENM